MIQCGDYNWEILFENDDSEVYKINLSHENGDITLLYGDGNFTVRYTKTMFGEEGDFFIFKIDFDKTPLLVKAVLDGEKCTLAPIYHINTVKTL